MLQEVAEIHCISYNHHCLIAAGSMFWDLNVAWDPKRAAACADLALRPVGACMRLEGLGQSDGIRS